VDGFRVRASRDGASGRNFRRNSGFGKGCSARGMRGATFRFTRAAQLVRPFTRACRKAHRVGVLSCSERIEDRHAAENRRPDRTLCPGIPPSHISAAYFFPSQHRKHEREPCRRRHQRRGSRSTARAVSADAKTLCHFRAPYLHLFVLYSTGGRCARNVRLSCREGRPGETVRASDAQAGTLASTIFIRSTIMRTTASSPIPVLIME